MALFPFMPAPASDNVEAVGLLALGEGCITSDEPNGFGADVKAGRVERRPKPTSRIFLWLWHCLLFLLPSFLLKRPSISGITEESPRPTAWLDGLRGVAAWAVVNTHIATALFKTAGAVWSPNTPQLSLIQLPILRLFYKGDAAVAIFFVISGYALSVSPIKHMNNTPRDSALGFRRLASSLIRRPVRLLFPAWTAATLVFLFIRLDLFASTAAAMTDESIVMGYDFLRDDYPPRQPSIFNQFCHLWRANLGLLSLSTASLPSSSHHYLSVLWTIAVEFRGSLYLFLTHLALFFLRRRTRIVILCAAVVLARIYHDFEMPFFWTGHILAELAANPASASHTSTSSLPLVVLDGFLFLLGAYLASAPGWGFNDTKFYSWLTPITPFVQSWTPHPSMQDTSELKRMIVAIGVILMMLVINRRRKFQSFFCWGPIHYLGKISFSLYLVHLWIVRGLGLIIWYRLFGIFGQSNWFAYFAAFIIGYVINLAAAVWAADIFWRTVDKCSIWLGKELERRLILD